MFHKLWVALAIATFSIFALATAASASTTWTTPVTVATQSNPSWMVSVSSGPGTITTAWVTTQMQAVKSTDHGQIWSSPTAVSTGSGSIDSPDIASDGAGHVGLVWVNGGGATSTIRAAFSSNAGASWSAPVTISDVANSADHVHIVSTGSGSFDVVFDQLNTIYSRTTPSMGSTWSAFHAVSLGGTSSGAPHLFVQSGTIYATWYTSLSGQPAVQFSKSTNGGSTWSVPVTASSVGGNNRWYPEIAVSASGHVVISWYQHVGSDWPVFYATSTDGGSTWSSEVAVSSSGGSDSQKLAVDAQGQFVLVWHTLASSSHVFASTSADGLTWTAPVQLDSTGSAIVPRIVAIPGGGFFVNWNAGITMYSRTSSDGSTWDPVQTLTTSGHYTLASATEVESGQGVGLTLMDRLLSQTDWNIQFSWLQSLPLPPATGPSTSLPNTGQQPLGTVALVALLTIFGGAAGMLITRVVGHARRAEPVKSRR